MVDKGLNTTYHSEDRLLEAYELIKKAERGEDMSLTSQLTPAQMREVLVSAKEILNQLFPSETTSVGEVIGKMTIVLNAVAIASKDMIMAISMQETYKSAQGIAKVIAVDHLINGRIS